MHSVLLFLNTCIPPCFNCIDHSHLLSAFFFDFRMGQIDLRMIGAALTSRSSVLSYSLMPSANLISDWTFGTQSSALSLGLSLSPLQLYQFAVSEILPGALSSSLSTGWQLILFIWQTSNSWVWPPERLFVGQASVKVVLSDNLNADAPSCWRSDQDAWMISSLSEIYLIPVICLIGVCDSFCIAYWLGCHLSRTSWTLDFCAIVSPPPPSSFLSRFLYSSYTMPSQRLPICYY